ncbi:MAG: hydrolase TatD [Desulfobulbus propionicus]|nr:MAG: hydrolase TatD [Desulfobulbus propionicus]PIE60396.1 MAG: hydrolase TatD [Desulfobulbus propionicus]
MNISLIDSHCHLDMQAYENDLDQVLHDALAVGVKNIITIGIDLPSSKSAVTIAGRYDQVYATIGIHPHEATSCTKSTLASIEDLAHLEKVVGYGEIGLDYAKKYSPVDVQQKAFAAQLQLAKKVNLPVVIHDRDAHEDTMAILRENGPYPKGGVMHCFSGNLELANKVVELGFYLSIPGIVTFKNAQDLHNVAQHVDINHLLLETDGPFLAPVPFRGKRNTPDKVMHTAKRVAELRNISLEEVASITTMNACNLFNLPSV